jgi:hypothetical protein
MGQVIGLDMTNGYAGAYSRQPDQIIDTRVAGSGGVAFGQAVKYSSGAVVAFGAGDAATDFVGVATRAVKTSLVNGTAGYFENEPVPVMKRGRINVLCNYGSPALNGDVYVRIAANGSIPEGIVGGFEATSDSTNSVKLTNAKWAGAKDANGIAELEIFEPINA